MENSYVWYDIFLETLHKKFPKKTDLIQALMELLYIEREAVYRRLRKDVIFTIQEVAKIVTAWNISLDMIIGVNSDEVPFQMRRINYIDPSEEELQFLRTVIAGIELMSNYPEAELMDICNKLPRQILAHYQYLNQFYLFKCSYQYSHGKEYNSFSQATVSDEKLQLTADYCKAIKNVPNTSFLWDRRLLNSLVSDIKYFYSILLINDEEKELIKKDLYNLIDYYCNVANKGYYPETKCKVNLYISELNIDTNYSYIFSPEANICFVHVFEKYEIYTFDKEMVIHFRNWMQLKKKTSIQISEVDERRRIEYFANQKEIVDEL